MGDEGDWERGLGVRVRLGEWVGEREGVCEGAWDSDRELRDPVGLGVRVSVGVDRVAVEEAVGVGERVVRVRVVVG